jgi:Colicin D
MLSSSKAFGFLGLFLGQSAIATTVILQQSPALGEKNNPSNAQLNALCVRKPVDSAHNRTIDTADYLFNGTGFASGCYHAAYVYLAFKQPAGTSFNQFLYRARVLLFYVISARTNNNGASKGLGYRIQSATTDEGELYRFIYTDKDGVTYYTDVLAHPNALIRKEGGIEVPPKSLFRHGIYTGTDLPPGAEEEIASDDTWLERLTTEDILLLAETGALFIPYARLARIAGRTGSSILGKYPRIQAFLRSRTGTLFSRGASREGWALKISDRQLQMKYKHAKALGIEGNYNKKNAAEFAESLRHHIYNNPNTKRIVGTFRKNENVIHYVDPKTGINVMTERNGTLKSIWKLNERQLPNVLERGSL